MVIYYKEREKTNFVQICFTIFPNVWAWKKLPIQNVIIDSRVSKSLRRAFKQPHFLLFILKRHTISPVVPIRDVERTWDTFEIFLSSSSFPPSRFSSRRPPSFSAVCKESDVSPFGYLIAVLRCYLPPADRPAAIGRGTSESAVRLESDRLDTRPEAIASRWAVSWSADGRSRAGALRAVLPPIPHRFHEQYFNSVRICTATPEKLRSISSLGSFPCYVCSNKLLSCVCSQILKYSCTICTAHSHQEEL